MASQSRLARLSNRSSIRREKSLTCCRDPHPPGRFAAASNRLLSYNAVMALLIKNGQVVTAADRYVADIFCQDQTITRIERDLPATPGTEVIDATGKLVFPGFIDPHVHIYLPFMGTFAKDTHETASKAALIGGTTTFIEMICPARTDEPMAAFELWMGKAKGKSACDYSFHMGVTRYDEKAEPQLKEIVKRGV